MILEEFGRFLRHKSTGVRGYESMPSEWPDVVRAIRNKSPFGKKDLGPSSVAIGWSQEERDLGFILSSKIGKRCEVKLPRNHAADRQARLNNHEQTIVNNGVLQTSILVPNTAGTLDIEIDLRGRCITISITVKAPSDRKRSSASLNWLLRQIPEEADKPHIIRVNWPGRSIQTSESLAKARNNPETLLDKDTGLMPVSFEITRTVDLGSTFESRKKIIEELERHLIAFYEGVAEHIKPFVALPPKTRDLNAVDVVIEESERLSEKLEAALEESLFGD
jgi:hypothetical protein